MLLTTIALAATLATSATVTPRGAIHRAAIDGIIRTHSTHPARAAKVRPSVALDLHSMTEEEKRLFPGRERFDKIEWYESCFKGIKTLIAPEHVDEWQNGGIDVT